MKSNKIYHIVNLRKKKTLKKFQNAVYSHKPKQNEKKKHRCLPNIVIHEAKWTIRIIYWRQVKHKVIFSTLILIQSVVVYSIAYITLSMPYMMPIWANETNPKETYKFKYTRIHIKFKKNFFFRGRFNHTVATARNGIFTAIFHSQFIL